MRRSFRAFYLLSGSAIMLVLSGCGGMGKSRDAANELRADLSPGLYKFSTTGSLFGISARGSGRKDKSMCVSPEMASDWPSPFVREYLMPDESCSLDEYNRKGNALYGKVTCTPNVERDQIGGQVAIKYTGQMDSNSMQLNASFDIDLELSDEQKARDPEAAAKLKQGMAMMNHAGIKLEATRAGDC